jgi:hypothetical protein
VRGIVKHIMTDLPDLVARIDATPVERAPFAHVYVDEIFPPAYYATLLDRLPSTRRYRELRHRDAMRPDGRSTRRKLYLHPEHIMLLPRELRAFWGPLARQLRGRALQEALKRKFREDLERRFGRSIDRLSFYPVPMLLRDLGGYRIGIHGDSLGKAMTVQFYLPRDESQAHCGTIFHEGRSGAAARRTKTLPFRPAAAYAFPVVYHASWHSVAELAQADGPRDSLMLTYYVQDGVGRWLLQRLRRAWLFVAHALRR